MEMQARVERLEGLCRRLTLALAGSWLLVGVSLVAGAGRAPKIIEAKQFVLVGDDGKARGTLGTSEEGTILSLRDDAGASRILIGTTPDGQAAINCMGGQPKATAAFGVRGDDRPFVVITDRAGKQLWTAP